jgi:hypothetical protein
MTATCNATAWALACHLFGRNVPTIESTLSDTERDALALLADLKAVKLHNLDARFMLCPYCQLLRGAVVRRDNSLFCECPDCGLVPVDKPDARAWLLDADWLIRKLRGALNIPSQQAPVQVIGGIWRLGGCQRHDVILGRNPDHALRLPAVLSRAASRNPNPVWLITPKPMNDVDHEPGSVIWLPLEERFSLYGGNLHFTEPGKLFESDEGNRIAVNGPFSEDFRTVHVDGWKQGPITLSEAQAAVFKSLWHFKGVPQSAERIMDKAGLGSTKPIDVFKVKTQNKGDSRYEGPLHAYRTLVDTDRRAGTYTLPCAASAAT